MHEFAIVFGESDDVFDGFRKCIIGIETSRRYSKIPPKYNINKMKVDYDKKC